MWIKVLYDLHVFDIAATINVLILLKRLLRFAINCDKK